jgi:hypothetical protein
LNLSQGSGTSLMLSGTATVINGWLASGALHATGGAGALQLSVLAHGVSTVGAVAVNASVTSSGAQAAPQLKLPLNWGLPASAPAQLMLGADAVTGSGNLTLTLSSSAGTLSLQGEVSALAPTGSGTASVSLSGTAAALNTYLASGQLQFNGGNATLTARLQPQGSSAPEVQAVATLNTTAMSSLAPTLALQVPGSLPLLGEPAALPLGAGVLSATGLTGNVSMSLVPVNPSAGQWVITTGGLASVNTSGHLLLTGTVSQINAWLANGDNLAWSGQATAVLATASAGQAQAQARFELANAAPGVLSVNSGTVPVLSGPVLRGMQVVGNLVITNDWLSQQGLASGAALKLQATGDITWQATGVSLASIELQAGGALQVQGVLEASRVQLTAASHITGISTAQVRAEQLTLNTLNGDVGTASAALRIDLQGSAASLGGQVRGAAYLSELSGDLSLQRLRVSGLASLSTASGSILGVSQAGVADLQLKIVRAGIVKRRF